MLIAHIHLCASRVTERGFAALFTCNGRRALVLCWDLSLLCKEMSKFTNFKTNVKRHLGYVISSSKQCALPILTIEIVCIE